MQIYVASSWRNTRQPDVVRDLRAAGHEVYDFRNPRPGENGFHWSEIDPQWLGWSAERFREALEHPIAARGFASDWDGMLWADACVLVLPCGRSAHLEAGTFVGSCLPLYILLEDQCEPELMYKMATGLCLTTQELITQLAAYRKDKPARH